MKERNDTQNIYDRYMGFPEGLTYGDFIGLPEPLRRRVIENNRIIQTDTYNRTMEHVQGKEGEVPETYVMQLRRAQEGYLIVYGMREQLENIASVRITQSELDFAKEFYEEHARVPFFNAEKWQKIIDEHDGRLPFDIDAVPDGTAILPGDPVMRVTGPGELVAHFEPYFHRIFYPSRVATIAHEISEKIGSDRFIEVGKRGVPTEETHLIAAAAMYVGGNISLTSNDAAAATYEMLGDVGTIGHRYVQASPSETEAFRAAVDRLDSVALLVDLHNSINGIDMAIQLKEDFRDSGKRIWMRLDSGDVSSQTIYALDQLRQRGFEDPVLDKIIVEGIESVGEMVEIDERAKAEGFDPEKYVLYGAGELLVYKNTGRSYASTGFKLTRHGERDTMKYSDSPGKASFPGAPTLVEDNGQRVIAQVGEFPQGTDLLIPVFRSGKILLSEDFTEARNRAEFSYESIREQVVSRKVSQISSETKEKMHKYKEQVNSST